MTCCGRGRNRSRAPLNAPAVPGQAGLVRLRYTGMEPVVYGEVTGARYPFGEANPRLVDARDAARLLRNPAFLVEAA